MIHTPSSAIVAIREGRPRPSWPLKSNDESGPVGVLNRIDIGHGLGEEIFVVVLFT